MNQTSLRRRTSVELWSAIVTIAVVTSFVSHPVCAADKPTIQEERARMAQPRVKVHELSEDELRSMCDQLRHSSPERKALVARLLDSETCDAAVSRELNDRQQKSRYSAP